jgi:hypothetical protein
MATGRSQSESQASDFCPAVWIKILNDMKKRKMLPYLTRDGTWVVFLFISDLHCHKTFTAICTSKCSDLSILTFMAKHFFKKKILKSVHGRVKAMSISKVKVNRNAAPSLVISPFLTFHIISLIKSFLHQ